MTALNASWKLNSSAQIIYGDDLLCDEIIDDTGNVIGYSIIRQQNLELTTDYDLICSYRYRECVEGQECKDPDCTKEHTVTYYPILEIAPYAFEMSEFNSITLKYDDEHLDYHYPVNIGSGAFFGAVTDSINFEVDITLNDLSDNDNTYSEGEEGTSINVFAGSTLQSVTLPDSLDRIPRSTFSLCFNLKYIYNTNANIAVNTLSDKIVSIDTSAFECCTELEMLIIPETIQKIGNAAFDFWGSTDTRQIIKINLYKPGELWDANWTGTLQSNASVEFNKIVVELNKQDGTGGSDGVEVTYGQAMAQAEAPERVGYNFVGYFSEPEGHGKQYYDKDMNSVNVWDKEISASTLYADWKGKDYNVILNDGVVVTATFGEDMPVAVIPDVGIGFSFKGYEGPDKKLYYNSDMSSAHVWDIAEDNVQLNALKSSKEYTVNLNDNVTVTARFGDDMPVADAPSHAQGRVFTGYSYNGTLYYNADMTSAHVWDIDEDNVTLKYESVELVTTIIYKLNGGTNAAGNKTSLKYSETLILQNPTQVGYAFEGWEYNDKIYTSLHNIDEEKITLSAIWKFRIDRAEKIELSYTDTSVNWYSNTNIKNYIIVLPKVDFKTHCTIIVPSHVEGIHVYSPNGSVYSMCIKIAARTTDFNLILENLTMTIPVSDNFADFCIYMRPDNDNKLNLSTYGYVAVKGHQGESGKNGGVAIYCSTIEICYAENLLITGGNGGVAASGGQVGLGGTAIELVAQAPIINQNVYDNVVIRGGCAGDNGSCSRSWIVSGRLIY